MDVLIINYNLTRGFDVDWITILGPEFNGVVYPALSLLRGSLSSTQSITIKTFTRYNVIGIYSHKQHLIDTRTHHI